jgi:diguanylate cyclase (GGDEF)-like protein
VEVVDSSKTLSAERTRALLIAKRARIPIYIAMVQVAIVSTAVPLALDFRVLAGIGVVTLVALWATSRAVDQTIEAFHVCSHLAYAASLGALAYSIFELEISGRIAFHSTASLLIGAAYLLGTRAALLWSLPCLILAGCAVVVPYNPEITIPQAASFVIRTVSLGTILGYAVAFRWAHEDQVTQLQFDARTDALTGLANRLAFDEALVQALGRASRFNRTGAVIFADLDGMKSINDNFGHDVGDAFLKEVGHRIRTLTRIIDTPARLGGDEFVILLSEFADPKGAEIVARRLSEIVAEPWHVDGREIRPSASIGIAEFSEIGEGPQALLRLADDAMYEAKRSDSIKICVARHGRIDEVL